MNPTRVLPGSGFACVLTRMCDCCVQGVCDGMTYAEIAHKFPEDYEARKRDKLRYRCVSKGSVVLAHKWVDTIVASLKGVRAVPKPPNTLLGQIPY